eukprot:TRINITY_DN3317_c0_g1_i5.p1 TRINITY_DN3317_c0_g1~~TRINITY_DN3317_c0_g1_i5.p1  ORF type:complete len:224 (-),score=59.67 TRINITY_DN3317_c0_g1_i5:13-684(-)
MRSCCLLEDGVVLFECSFFFFFQAEDGIRDVERSRGLGDVYKRQEYMGLKVDLEEINDCVFGYRKIIKDEELDMIARFDTTKDQKPCFEIAEIEKLNYEEFIQFLNNLYYTIPEPPAMIIAKKRGTFLREVGTFGKKWKTCTVYLSSDYVLHLYDKEEDAEPQVSLRLRASTIQIQEIHEKKIISLEEPVKGLFSSNKKLKVRIDNPEEFLLWNKEFTQAIPH